MVLTKSFHDRPCEVFAPPTDNPKNHFMAFELSGYLTISTCVRGSGLNTDVIASPLLSFSLPPETAQSVSAFVRNSCPRVLDKNGSVEYLYFCFRRSSKVPRAPEATIIPFEEYIVLLLLKKEVMCFVSI